MEVQTNITDEIREVFDALTSRKFTNFALFSCFVNGTPTSAIVAVNHGDAGDYHIQPLFVAVTPEMVLTDHDGVQPGP